MAATIDLNLMYNAVASDRWRGSPKKTLPRTSESILPRDTQVVSPLSFPHSLPPLRIARYRLKFFTANVIGRPGKDESAAEG